jgi:integrase
MESADLTEFLTYTGARIDETRELTLDHVDWQEMTITFDKVKGDTRDKVFPIAGYLAPILKRCEERAAERGDRIGSTIC